MSSEKPVVCCSLEVYNSLCSWCCSRFLLQVDCCDFSSKSPDGEIHVVYLVVTGFFFFSIDFAKIICFLDGEKIDVVFQMVFITSG